MFSKSFFRFLFFTLKLTVAYLQTLRVFEEVCDLGLFLFSDALVLTRRKVHHKPFSLSRSDTHTFLASEALTCLSARALTHSRCEFTHTHARPRTHTSLEKTQRCGACVCRCDPCLCPGRCSPHLGVCGAASWGERPLPVCASLCHRLVIDSSSVTPLSLRHSGLFVIMLWSKRAMSII